MVLSDRCIRNEVKQGRIIVEPFDDSCVQPASLDIHLARSFQVFEYWKYPHYIDLRQPLDTLSREVEIDDTDYFSLQPSQFVLGSTMEHITIPNDIMGRLEGKSSLGRVGLLIHATAGYIDPGWRGTLTLELYNVSPMPIHLYPGMKISQISFHRLTTPAELPYGSHELGSKYLEQVGPTPTRYYQERGQPQLMSLSDIKLSSSKEAHQTKGNELRQWLLGSEFQGNIKKLAEALEAPTTTVANWIHTGAKPSLKYRARIFSLTKLSSYASDSTDNTLNLDITTNK